MSEARLASMPARTHLAAVVIVMNTLPLTRLLMLTRRDFNRFDSRPGRPHFSNFGPPAERRPFCKKALYSVSKKGPWFSGFGPLVGHSAPGSTLVDLTAKCLTLVTTTLAIPWLLGSRLSSPRVTADTFYRWPREMRLALRAPRVSWARCARCRRAAAVSALSRRRDTAGVCVLSIPNPVRVLRPYVKSTICTPTPKIKYVIPQRGIRHGCTGAQRPGPRPPPRAAPRRCCCRVGGCCG